MRKRVECDSKVEKKIYVLSIITTFANSCEFLLRVVSRRRRKTKETRIEQAY